jgi:hypothetical protein
MGLALSPDLQLLRELHSSTQSGSHINSTPICDLFTKCFLEIGHLASLLWPNPQIFMPYRMVAENYPPGFMVHQANSSISAPLRLKLKNWRRQCMTKIEPRCSWYCIGESQHSPGGNDSVHCTDVVKEHDKGWSIEEVTHDLLRE